MTSIGNIKGPGRAAAPEQSLIERPCPLCAADDDEIVFRGTDTVFNSPGGWNVVRCRSCRMMYINPAVDPAEISEFYPKSYPAHAPDQGGRSRQRRDPWDRLAPIGKGRLLDVGCGSGGYLMRQRSAGWKVWGVEPSANAVDAARAAGLEVFEGTIPGVELPEREFEAIVVLGVLGCIADPMVTLRTLRNMLIAGGSLIVSVHNAGSAAAEIFGPSWQGWDLPRHYNHFTPQTLVEMIRRAGFVDPRLEWRRRSSRWRHSARAMVRSGATPWHLRLAARSRQWASLLASIHSRGPRSDEIIVIAGG